MKTQQGLYVEGGRDRFQDELKIWGVIPLQVKVSTTDSDGRLFLFEHKDMSKGGPPRHLHFEQDEWFYAIEGEFAFEVGDDSFTLRPGDSLFAPRMIPHVWANLDDRGTLLLGVQPAGSLESFFRAECEKSTPPPPDEAARMFEAHGMRIVGPPLDV
jgi:mannose-6-phosphate isomerase-like protein (cupin superfamily)